MPISRTQKIVATSAASLGLLLGAAGITAAATTGGEGGAADNESPAYQSSVTAPEDSSIDGLAKITEADAKDAAEAATGGTAGKVELENENGNVVYGVEITQSDGTALDVKVDAGNGDVLAQEADEHDGEHEANDDAESAESESKESTAKHSAETPDAEASTESAGNAR